TRGYNVCSNSSLSARAALGCSSAAPHGVPESLPVSRSTWRDPMDGSELMSQDRQSRRGVTHAGSRARLDLDVLAASSADVCILISGPSGAKDIAQRIHGLTRARPGRFRAVDCGWPEALLDQQLFHAIRPGSSGTVFLEEVGRLSPELQNRLLE